MEDERGKECSMGGLRNAYKNPGMETWKKKKDYLGDLDMDGRLISERILMK
jgi:hypothetical protein